MTKKIKKDELENVNGGGTIYNEVKNNPGGIIVVPWAENDKEKTVDQNS